MIITIFFTILFNPVFSHAQVSQSDSDKLIQTIKANPDDVTSKQKLAGLLFREKKYSEVIKLLKADADTLNRSGLALLAKSFAKTNDDENEKLIYERLIALNANDFEAYVALGNLHLNKKKFDEAIKNYRLSLGIKTKFKPALEGLFKSFKKTNNRYELRLVIQDLIKIAGEKIEYVSELCRINTLDGFHDVAVKSCNQAITMEPNIPENYLFKAYIDNTLGNTKNVVNSLNESVKRFPKVDFVLVSYAIVLYQQKSFSSAEKYFNKAVELNSNSFENQIGLALTGYENKNYEISLKAFKQACNLEPYKSIRELKRVVNALKFSATEAWKNKFDLVLDSCTPANFKKLSLEAREDLVNNKNINTPFMVPLTMDPNSKGPYQTYQNTKPGESIFRTKEEGDATNGSKTGSEESSSLPQSNGGNLVIPKINDSED